MKRFSAGSFLGVLVGLGLCFGLLIVAWAEEAPVRKRLLLVPFQIEKTDRSDLTRCRACGNILSGGVVEGDPGPVLTRKVWELLTEQSKGFELIDPGQAEGVYQALLAKKIDQDPLRQMKVLGQELKADGVIWGGLFRYQDRKGTSYGVQNPASVSLDLHLLRVKDGEIVWKTQYSQTQKSLSEDLFQLGEVSRRGLRWMTAEELAQSGLVEMFKGFPGPQSLE